MSDRYVHFSLPSIEEEEIARVTEVLRSGWLTTGRVTAQLESEFAAYAGSAHALAVNSCTAGLHLALATLGVGPGDEVITTPLTFCATINVILQVGATPVLADVGADLNLDPSRAEALLTARTRAILPVHYAGLPCNMDRIWAIAHKRGLIVIEDAAHAVGAEYRGLKIGAGRSEAVCFSFYATKNMTTGEGGVVTTHSEDLAARMRVLSLHGMSRDAWNRYGRNGNWYYEVVECGFKYNLSDLLAAIGLVQLRKLDMMNARRAEIAASYDEAFSLLQEIELPARSAGAKHAWHLYTVRLNLDMLTINRAEFIDEMGRRGIGCSVHFIPIPLHPFYRRVLQLRDPCERALSEYPRLVSLPIYPNMTDSDVARVIRTVRSVVQQHRRRIWRLEPCNVAQENN